MPNERKRAIVLLSGGLDSATALAIAQSESYEVYALSFDYGQRHAFELEAARRVARAAQVRQQIVFPLNLRSFGASALTADMAVPKDRAEAEMSHGIPVTYVPARNTIFLSIALGWAESLGISDIFIGVNVLDYSGYPDCRPEYLSAFEHMANLGTKAGVEGKSTWRIHAPLIQMTKAEIIRTGTELGVDYSLTHSCYDPDSEGRPCRRCDSCRLRLKGFAEAGLTDPLDYSAANSR
jgi:7-cyano-7-deazaguanine synthase